MAYSDILGRWEKDLNMAYRETIKLLGQIPLENDYAANADNQYLSKEDLNELEEDIKAFEAAYEKFKRKEDRNVNRDVFSTSAISSGWEDIGSDMLLSAIQLRENVLIESRRVKSSGPYTTTKQFLLSPELHRKLYGETDETGD